uniref:Uncharacterized protein n=1 Tax=Odontella aurita TaxID=265563 RepID=A0A7S4M999_9STRA
MSDAKTAKKTDGGGAVLVRPVGLRSLLDVPVVRDATNDGGRDYNGNEESDDERRMNSIRPGKLFLLLRVLSTDASSSPGTENGIGDWSLDAIESILFEVLPSCHAYLCAPSHWGFSSSSGENGGVGTSFAHAVSAGAATSLLSGTVEAIVSSLARTEALSGGGCQSTVRTHRVLARWLGVVPGGGGGAEMKNAARGERTRTQHPLTREALLQVSHLYALRLAHLALGSGTSPPSVVARSSLRHFLSLLWELTADGKTESTTRERCGAALVRIIRGGIDMSNISEGQG